MITVRNRDIALALSVRTGTTGIFPGMLVKLVVGTAKGEQPKVVKAAAADIQDATVTKGIVQFNPTDSQTVDFTIDTNTQLLTVLDDEIPLNAQCIIFFGTLVIAYHESVLPAALKSAVVREPQKVAFDGDTSFPAVYASGGTDGTEKMAGCVYRVDGPEITMLLNV